MNIEHLNREMVDTLIDYVTVGRRAKGTKTVPIEIHWNFLINYRSMSIPRMIIYRNVAIYTLKWCEKPKGLFL